jgi:hypothetical protein
VRIRITQLPQPGELDEFDLRRFRVGEAYDVTPQLGIILVVGGYAEPASTFGRAEAADFGGPRRSTDQDD